MDTNVRYQLDFYAIPQFINAEPEKFILLCLEAKGDFLSHLFHSFYKDFGSDAANNITPDDFTVENYKITDNTYLLSIDVPEDFSDSPVCCIGYAIAYTVSEEKGIFNAKYYTLEKSEIGTTCIGSMELEGVHDNYGSLMPTKEENLAKISELYLNSLS